MLVTIWPLDCNFICQANVQNYLHSSPTLCIQPASTYSTARGLGGTCMFLSQGPRSWVEPSHPSHVGPNVQRNHRPLSSCTLWFKSRKQQSLTLPSTLRCIPSRVYALDFLGVAAGPTDTRYSCSGQRRTASECHSIDPQVQTVSPQRRGSEMRQTSNIRTWAV